MRFERALTVSFESLATVSSENRSFTTEIAEFAEKKTQIG